jgi:hypothetical protein
MRMKTVLTFTLGLSALGLLAGPALAEWDRPPAAPPASTDWARPGYAPAGSHSSPITPSVGGPQVVPVTQVAPVSYSAPLSPRPVSYPGPAIIDSSVRYAGTEPPLAAMNGGCDCSPSMPCDCGCGRPGLLARIRARRLARACDPCCGPAHPLLDRIRAHRACDCCGCAP